MRCVICDKFVTGGDVEMICGTCTDMIEESKKKTPSDADISYSVMPSITDSYGRVVTGGKYE